MNIMKTLREFRAERGLTREQMARTLDISLSLYNKIEFGQRVPSQNFLTRFKAAFPSFDMNIFFTRPIH